MPATDDASPETHSEQTRVLTPSLCLPLSPCFWILLIGAAVHGTMIVRAEPLQSANDRSRWCTVRSLLERQTYIIDDVRKDKGWDTIDLVKDGGHYLSTKPPILATWVAGISWCICRVTGWTLAKNTQAVTSMTLLFVNGLPLLISWILLHRLLRYTMQNAWGQGLLLGTAVFGTLLTPFAVTLNNHSVAAAGAMLTVYALWEILRNDKPWWGWFLLCGLSAGWTCAHELPAALLGVLTFLLACRSSLPKTFLAYLPAAVIPLALFFATNWLATGSWKPAYADYGTGKYRFVEEGVPSYWMEPKGVDRNVDSTPVYIFHCLFGHHGVFSLTPVWLLLIPAWFQGALALRRLGRKVQATIPLLSLFLTVAVLGFYLSRTENYNYGGVSCGLRWALWLTPFWIVSLIPVVDAWSDRRWFHAAMVPLFVVSTFSAWSRVDNPWRHPWIFTWMESRELIDFSEPRPELPHKLWSWVAAIPDVSDGKLRWMEFENASSIQGHCRMRMEAAPSASGNADLVRLTVTRRCGNEDAETICLVDVNRRKFAAGEKPAAYLRWPDAEVTPERQQADLAFLRGFPLLKDYRPGIVRYRKTLLRTDAFRCQHVLAQVKDESQKRQYRCDIWRCEELPFGIAEVEFQVLDLNGSLLHQERWQAVAAEPPPLPQAQWSPAP